MEQRLRFKFLWFVVRLILAMFHPHPPQSAFSPLFPFLQPITHRSRVAKCMNALHCAAAALCPYVHDIGGDAETPLEPTSWPLLDLSASCEIHSTPER